MKLNHSLGQCKSRPPQCDISRNRNGNSNGSVRSSRSDPSSSWRKSRRNVGDTVFVSSPTKVYIGPAAKHPVHHLPMPEKESSHQAVASECDRVKDVAKIRSKIFEDSLESQEICFYLGTCPLDFDGVHLSTEVFDKYKYLHQSNNRLILNVTSDNC